MSRLSQRAATCLIAVLFALLAIPAGRAAGTPDLDRELTAALARSGFTGRVEPTRESRLGRPEDLDLAELGRLLWFDKSGGLRGDNTCGGCHSPAHGFGDSQSIAIGVQNNDVGGDPVPSPDARGFRNAPIDSTMFGPAIAEFEFTLVFTDAPIDRYARSESNERFSDSQKHVIGVPQVAPAFGDGTNNVIFDDPGRDEDFGL
jgi:hypothetical protein